LIFILWRNPATFSLGLPVIELEHKMSKTLGRKTLTDDQIRTGTLVTKPAVAVVNKLASSVKAAQTQGRKEVTFAVKDLAKISSLLKAVVMNAKASDGTDFVANNTDPGDPVRVGD